MTDEEILRSAIALWGEKSQFDLAVGEIGELLTLFGRRAQGRDTKDQWVSEIADVLIMMSQLALIVGPEEVEAEMARKLARLEQRVKNNRM